MNPPVEIGLLGLGTVGAGTFTLLKRNAALIAARAGCEVNIRRIAVRDVNRKREVHTGDTELTTDIKAITDAADIDIVVELIGGEGVAKDAVLRAIANGKHIVTANKALIALHGDEIFAAAKDAGVQVALEAAVAGGIPIIKSIREGLAANRVQWLAGIINGTCNYILSKMEEDGAEFADCLRAAQAAGYAEADPSFDIGGVDAAHKLTILASAAFGIPLQFARVHLEGIEAITSADLHYARELGYRIKHLGIARRNAAGVELRVHPALIPRARMLANVGDVMNAVMVQSDAAGRTLYYGAGAGAAATASAVAADVADVVRGRTAAWRFDNAAEILPIEEVQTAYYLRLRVLNRPGVLAAIARIFGDSDISIDTVLQKGHERGDARVTVIMLTQRTREGQMNRALARVRELESVDADVVRVRVELG